MEPRKIFTQFDLWAQVNQDGKSLSARDSLLQNREESEPAVVRIPVLPEGEFPHPIYGKLEWTPEKFDQMIQNFNGKAMGAEPMLNFDHSTHNWFAVNSPAAGWPIRLEHEPGVGLFAIVELTDLGEEAIKNKRYRYISAEVADKLKTSTGKEIENLLSGMALTNVPFHDTMTGLFGKNSKAFCLSRREGAVTWVPKGKAKNTMTIRERFEALRAKLSKGEDDEHLKELATEAGLEDEEIQAIFSKPIEEEKVDLEDLEVKEPKELKATSGESFTLSKEQYEALLSKANKGDEANKLLMEQTAASAVHEFSGPGYIPNNKEALDAAKKIALSLPKEFATLFNAIKKAKGQSPVKDVQVLSNHGKTLGGEGEEELGNDMTFVEAVNDLCGKNPKLDRMEAMRIVQREQPELYKKHSAAARKRE